MADSFNLHPSDPRYEPLPPLSFDDGLSPPGTPLHEHPPIPMEDLPAGASRPRFMGLAANDDGTRIRDSYASSNYQGGGGSLNSSVYALNPGGVGAGNRSSALLTGGYRDDPISPRDEFDDASSPGGSPASPPPKPEYLSEKRAAYASPASKKRRWFWIGGGVAAVAVVAVVVAVYFGVVKKNGSSSGATSGGDSNSGSGSSGSGSGTRSVITGGDGSTVTMDDGSTFTYQNSFGGIWYYDPEDPFNNAARAQSWSPALNESFKYGTDVIRGYVNKNAFSSRVG